MTNRGLERLSEPDSRPPEGRHLYGDDAESSLDRVEGIPLTNWKHRGSNIDDSLSSGGPENDVLEMFSHGEEARVIRKLDRRLVLFVALLYLLSFLDRSNIGNAKAAGLERDLDLSEAQFHWILDGFYMTYIIFEFMRICYRIFPAHAYISICVALLGSFAALQSVATGFWSMFILRLLLGIAEASFGPGIPFYLSLFYRRDELASRTGLFIAAAPLANSFAGSLAWSILRFAGHGSIDGWRLLFIAEGFPNILLAVLAWYVIPDAPGDALWLTRRERRIAILRLQRGHAQDISHSEHSREGLNWSRIWSTFVDPKSYVVAFILFSLNVAFSSLPVFLPTIVENMGFSALAAQGLSAFPNLSAFAVVLLTSRLSDRFESRSVPLIIHALLAMSGYALLAMAPQMPHFLRYLCLFPMTAGFFSAVTMVIVWTVNNHESDEGKAIGSSILQVFGHLGSLLGQQLYPDSGAPYYVKSHAACAFFLALAAALAFVLRVVLKSANQKRTAARTGRQAVHEDDAHLVVALQQDEFLYIL